MKKKRIYLISIVVFIVAIAGIIYNYNRVQNNKADQAFVLLPRKGAAANTKEFQEVEKKVKELTKAIKTDPDDIKSLLKLAALFIQEARETGNYKYYDAAAMIHINKVLSESPSDFNALVFKSLIFLSQHHFAEGLSTAQQARQINPNNAYVYGLLVDGNVEMGNYDSAIAYSDKMVAIRPDLTSYSRISYLREIFGDYAGSIKAMKLAVEAGGRGDEHVEWTRVQLASLYEKTGDYKTADTLYSMSLSLRPNYSYALAGLGRVAINNKDYPKAIKYYQHADSLVSDNAFKEELSELYKLTGQNKLAQEAADAVVSDLAQNAQAGNDDGSIGHYADRELAYAYLKVNKLDKALEHAKLEYDRRPKNIDVNETMAWVYYNRGEYAKALPYLQVALKTNSKNPILMCRAALIYFKAGNKEMAKTMLASTDINNAYITQTLQAEAALIANKM
ncbi:MAG: tetratricopeptide repeat protein [Ferruginibacter sp.]